ncbi:MAG: translation initiation factor IF-2 [Candidatus Magasanikbacteria bacterium]
MKKRPPIITILGHVDHGKTTLLDQIRKTNLADKEEGGITQSIGAYEITHSGELITFIDTPGHKAFSKMRSRGAKVADLAVLVVAADDGVQPQTKEAIEHIRKADIPFIVAINKIDLEKANIEKTKNQLAQAEVYLEGRGGDVSFEEISAKEGTGVSDLLDLINLAAEVEELEYNPDADGEGIIINSFKDSNRGPVAGIVVKNGKIRQGDSIYTQETTGTVRTLENFKGKQVDSLEPSSPALVVGFNDLPKVGQKVKVGEKQIEKESSPSKDIKEVKEEEYPVVIKAGEAASLDVLRDMVDRVSTKETSLVVADAGVGDVHESDVKLAFSIDAIILGFSVEVDGSAKNMAKSQNVNIITSSVVYDLEQALQDYIEKIEGSNRREVKILDTFGTSEDKQIIGGKVVSGYVEDKEPFQIKSGEHTIGKGRIANLQSQKKDVQKAKEGRQVGIMVKANNKIKEGHRLIFPEK